MNSTAQWAKEKLKKKTMRKKLNLSTQNAPYKNTLNYWIHFTENIGDENNDMEAEALLSELHKEEQYQELEDDEISLEPPDILNRVNKSNNPPMEGTLRTMTFNCDTALRCKVHNINSKEKPDIPI